MRSHRHKTPFGNLAKVHEDWKIVARPFSLAALDGADCIFHFPNAHAQAHNRWNFQVANDWVCDAVFLNARTIFLRTDSDHGGLLAR
jgi:hypothetical protein